MCTWKGCPAGEIRLVITGSANHVMRGGDWSSGPDNCRSALATMPIQLSA